jgi:hypothetical protein
LSTTGEIEAALRETKVKAVRLKQRLAAMRGDGEVAGDRVRGWIDSSMSDSSPGDHADS